MSYKKLSLSAGLVAVVAGFLWLPALHAAVLVLNLFLHLVVLGMQLGAALLPKFLPARRRLGQSEPFVSIHVPAHNEPPDLLGETLRSLARLKWSNYEVIVIDNNTRDPEVWRPVEKLCEELGPRFRFFHVDGIQGFKAGALNYLRRHVDPRAEYIFVVDADYVVDPEAIDAGLRHFTTPEIGLVQFPQDYRNIGPGNLGLALDLKHFFAGYMNMANHLGCVPSTGTLTFLRVAALREVGGFGTDVVTEDADLGLKLNQAGWRSVFVNQSIGHGLMPHDLESLKKQRWRWAFGNAQILKLNARRILFSRSLSFGQKLGYVMHLTAWFNFNLLPALTLMILAPWFLLRGLTDPVQPYLIVISGFTLVTFTILRFGTLFYALRREGHRMTEIAKAFLSHLGLGLISSTSWIKCLWNHREPFVRTNKFISSRIPGPLRAASVEMAMGVMLVIACILLAFMDYLLGPIAALVLAGSRFSILWVARQLRFTFDLTRRVMAPPSWLSEVTDRVLPEPPEVEFNSDEEADSPVPG